MPADDTEPPVEIVADERVAAVDSGVDPVMADWVSRALYVGEAGARNWLSVVGEPGYALRDPTRFGLAASRLSAIRSRQFATIVSFGPGDGLNEVNLVRTLGGTGRRVQYIPVEISLPLLRRAIANLRPHADVPVGVLCDFEGSWDFLASALRQHASPASLYLLLGGTVGNLDLGEPRFFAKLRSQMGPCDALLVDVPLAGPGWTAAGEPRLRAEAYTASFRRFLGGADGERFIGRFDQVGLSHTRDPVTRAETILVIDTVRGRQLLTFRRYWWEPLLDWFRSQGFKIGFAQTSIASVEDKFGMGVVLLTAA